MDRAEEAYTDVEDELDRLKDVATRFRLDRARFLIRNGRVDEARHRLDAFLARMTDPLAERIRAEARQLLAACAIPAT